MEGVLANKQGLYNDLHFQSVVRTMHNTSQKLTRIRTVLCSKFALYHCRLY